MDIHTTAADIPMVIIYYDNAPAMAEELPMENIISKGDICYDQVPKPVSVGEKITTSGVMRNGWKIIIGHCYSNDTQCNLSRHSLCTR